MPMGDRLLYEKYSFCLNLTGPATITYLDPGNNFVIVAHDICLCNALLNYFGSDSDGSLARTGKVNEDLLDKLRSIP